MFTSMVHVLDNDKRRGSESGYQDGDWKWIFLYSVGLYLETKYKKERILLDILCLKETLFL